jgi:methylglutamate dehydrogenase subunit B
VTSLVCPFCGPREIREFTFHKTVAPEAGGAYERVYERRDRADRSLEHWQHAEGCRAWLRIERNPSTGEVVDVRLEGGVST